MAEQVTSASGGLVNPFVARIVKPGKTTKTTTSLLGPSGTGKTEQIGRLIDGGRKVLVVSTEDKLSTIAARNPDVFVVDKLDFPRHANEAGIASDLWEVVKFIRGSDHSYDVVALDSGMKYASRLLKYLKYESVPRLTGHELWGGFGERLLSMVEKFKELADAAKTSRPVHFVMTFGVEMGQDWQQKRSYQPLLDGKMVAPRMPYEFDNVLMLQKRTQSEKLVYACYTAGTDEFDAKVSGVTGLPSVIVNPDLNQILLAIEQGAWPPSAAK